MKQLKLIAFFTILFIMGLVIAGNAQTQVKLDQSGNYVPASVKDSTNYQATGKTFTDTKGVKYPVYVSKNGKLFYKRISKNTGKEYRVYIKTN